MSKNLVLSIAVFLGILVGARMLWDYRMPFVVAIALYLLVNVAVEKVLGDATPKETAVGDGDEWPTSGPVGEGGQRLLMATFTVSGLLSFFNPFQLVQMILQEVGDAVVSRRLANDEFDPSAFESEVEYHLPFRGEWFVYNGGVTSATSHSWDIVTQRYAYDFVVVDDDLVRHEGRGTRLTDYHCYGREILAVADGEVVKLVDNIGDAPFVGYGIVDFLARNFVGNHVIIRHAEKEYSLSAHLIPKSVCVAVGDQVRRGDVIGRCGHSGHSSEPHLHFHLQDGANFYLAAGLPIRFQHLTVDGHEEASAVLTRGCRVVPSP